MIVAALNALAGLVLAVNGQTYNGAGQTVEYLIITGSDITVMNLRVRESGPGNNSVSVSGNRNVLQHLIVERSGGTGVVFMSGTGHILEDSTIRDPVTQPGHDSYAIYSAASGTVTVRRNTVYGSGFSNYTSGSVVLEDNHFVVPEDYRTDCAGVIERDGPCQCAEIGIALKSGNAVIRGNVISGYRTADPICGGTGSPGAGIEVDACGPVKCATDNVLLFDNTIRDSHFGIYVGRGATRLRIVENQICGSDEGISDGFGAPSMIIDNEFAGNTVDLNLYGTRSGPVSGNSTVTTSCL